MKQKFLWSPITKFNYNNPQISCIKARDICMICIMHLDYLDIWFAEYIDNIFNDYVLMIGV